MRDDSILLIVVAFSNAMIFFGSLILAYWGLTPVIVLTAVMVGVQILAVWLVYRK